MTKVEQQLMLLAGLLVLAFGTYVTIGWLLAIPAMVRIMPGSTVMVFNTAICFVIAGLWLTLKASWGLDNASSRSSHWLATTLALGLILLPVLVLVEIAGNYDFGIDWTVRHKLVPDRNVTPGRMAPNTCLAFLFVGAALLCDRLKTLRVRKLALVILGGCTFLMGVSSLAAYMLNLDRLYDFAQQNRMAFPTAAGLTLVGLVLMMAGRSGVYEIPADNKGEDIRLTRIAAIIMVVLALASGLTGFITLKQGTDEALRKQLQQTATTNAASFLAAFERRYILADKLFSFPVFAKDLATLPVTPNDADSLEHIRKVGSILLGMGFSGLQINDTHDSKVFSLGTIVEHPDLSVPIKITDQDAFLLWSDGLVLRIEHPIVKDNVTIGKVITEQPMTGVDRLLQAIQFSGATTDSGLCHRDGDFIECFPSRLVPRIARAPFFRDGKPALPMSHALLGETGIIYANDIRGLPVLAAFTPVGSTGLGLVSKIDTTEIYSFIRERLDVLLGILALFVIAGTYVLRLSIQPLASRLVRSEQRMREANEVLEKAQQKLTHMAQYDALTGLPNRSLFMDRLSIAVLRASRNKNTMALMFLDLDGFKLVNDQYGHQAGDALLKQFAERLTATVRKVDTVARLAGDEFTIILEELAEPEENVQIVAAKIIHAMTQPFEFAGTQAVVTTSIGIVLSKSEAKNIDALIHAADTEMYKAKNKGKNQFSLTWI